MESEGKIYSSLIPLAQEAQYPLRLAVNGALITQQAHGDGWLASYNELTFGGGNQGPTGQVTTVALATTCTGLILSNPIGSNVLVSLNNVTAAFSVVFAAAAHIGLMGGYNGTTDVTHSTPLTIRSFKLGSASASKAKLDSASTLPTAPTVLRTFESVVASAKTAFSHDMDGSIQLPPGAYVAIYTSTVSAAAAMMASFEWEEFRIA